MDRKKTLRPIIVMHDGVRASQIRTTGLTTGGMMTAQYEAKRRELELQFPRPEADAGVEENRNAVYEAMVQREVARIDMNRAGEPTFDTAARITYWQARRELYQLRWMRGLEAKAKEEAQQLAK